MPLCFSIKLHSETQVSGRLGMSGGRSPRHAQNPLSGERALQCHLKDHLCRKAMIYYYYYTSGIELIIT